MSRVAIVDYGLGNLFSVARACEVVGLEPVITADRAVIHEARAVFLPGVGAFGHAMTALADRDLIEPLRELAASSKPLIGICLGMQLLMARGRELGDWEGLGVIAGDVISLPIPPQPVQHLKVPQIGWNRVCPVGAHGFAGTPMADLSAADELYFNHSFRVRPEDGAVVRGETNYGQTTYPSFLVSQPNNLAFQFHPERSGPAGLKIYHRLARLIEGA